MKDNRVKDIMVPLNEYALVPMNANLREALITLKATHKKTPPGKHPHRAVLVTNSKGLIVGKLGMAGFLRALEPKYGNLGDIERLSRAGVSAEFLDTMMEDLGFWKDDVKRLCTRANSIIIKDVMSPIEESILDSASLTEAMHKMIMWQVLSMLVTSDEEVVGILRLSDLFTEVADFITSDECGYEAGYYEDKDDD